MTKEEKQALLQGLFQGANLEHAQVNVVVESGATVTYNAVVPTASKAGRKRKGRTWRRPRRRRWSMWDV